MNEGQLAQAYWTLKNQEAAISAKLAEIRAALVKNTDTRRAGDFLVKVDSSDRQIMDQEAAREALEGAGIAVPMKSSPTVRLTVKPWVALETLGVA